MVDYHLPSQKLIHKAPQRNIYKVKSTIDSADHSTVHSSPELVFGGKREEDGERQLV